MDADKELGSSYSYRPGKKIKTMCQKLSHLGEEPTRGGTWNSHAYPAAPLQILLTEGTPREGAGRCITRT